MSFGANCVAPKLVSQAHTEGHCHRAGAQRTPLGALFWNSTQKVWKIGKPNQDTVLFFCKKRCCALNAHFPSTQVTSRCRKAALAETHHP